MNPELKQKWIEALRSGKYKQTHDGVLRYHDRFCCLGVLCDLVDQDGWKDHPKYSEIGYQTHRFAGQMNGGVMDYSYPNPKKIKCGMSWRVMREIADLNDGINSHVNPKGKEHSFAEIADYIEANL